MKILCKTAEGNCPRNLKICCGHCEYRESCLEACPSNMMEGCPHKEVVEEELVAFQTAIPDTIQEITDVLRMKKMLDEQEKALKEALVEAMEKFDVKSFENDYIKMVYVAPTTRTTIDTARLRKEAPGLAAEYSKTSEVAASVRVTVK